VSGRKLQQLTFRSSDHTLIEDDIPSKARRHFVGGTFRFS